MSHSTGAPRLQAGRRWHAQGVPGMRHDAPAVCLRTHTRTHERTHAKGVCTMQSPRRETCRSWVDEHAFCMHCNCNECTAYAPMRTHTRACMHARVHERARRCALLHVPVRVAVWLTCTERAAHASGCISQENVSERSASRPYGSRDGLGLNRWYRL